MSGEGYHNLVKEVHRIYAYMTEGFDTASFIGQANVRDNFNASPEEARLYNKDFYLSARGFDEAHSTATDTLDRAYLYASEGDDYLSLVDDEIELRGDNFTLHTSNYNYARVSANQGGLDEAHLRGTNLNDYLRSRPTEATFDYGKRRLIAGGFERIVAVASTGNDTADFYDSHYTDVFSADSERASIKNAINETTAIGFKQVNAYMEAGGDDSATIGGSKAADRFQVSPTDWTMQGNGSFLFGSGFTNVTCHGESHDKIYLYDSSGNDKLEIREDRVTMSGQRFSNTAIGFGKVNSEATIFGRGFSYNATGFDGIDAYYSTLDGKDNVDLDGNIEYDLLATDLAEARYQLSLALTSDSDRITQKSRVKKLL
ncbi:unnamed protein product [Symbiodinium sp. CCMP2456]|nr:unnamed protein product [Symbiodinium sp. CCMP2456]